MTWQPQTVGVPPILEKVAIAPHSHKGTRALAVHTLQMAVRQVRTSRSGSVRRRQAATLRPRIMMRRTSLGDACSCKQQPLCPHYHPGALPHRVSKGLIIPYRCCFGNAGL